MQVAENLDSRSVRGVQFARHRRDYNTRVQRGDLPAAAEPEVDTIVRQ